MYCMCVQDVRDRCVEITREVSERVVVGLYDTDALYLGASQRRKETGAHEPLARRGSVGAALVRQLARQDQFLLLLRPRSEAPTHVVGVALHDHLAARNTNY